MSAGRQCLFTASVWFACGGEVDIQDESSSLLRDGMERVKRAGDKYCLPLCEDNTVLQVGNLRHTTHAKDLATSTETPAAGHIHSHESRHRVAPYTFICLFL